jgi:hypothetical protein
MQMLGGRGAAAGGSVAEPSRERAEVEPVGAASGAERDEFDDDIPF